MNVDRDDDLQERRARNDSQLKSTLETIFEKYSKNFEGIGDEIDMRTGEIVVNNGHILAMSHERDVGDVEASCEELESGYYSEDEVKLSLGYANKHRRNVLKSDNLVVMSALSQAELIWHCDDDADSLMGEVDLQAQGVEAGGEMTAVFASEEDELASSEYEWMNPRHIRAIAQDRWSNRKQQLESLDERDTDPVWRAPPLPKPTVALQAIEHRTPFSIGDVQGESESEGQRISIWAPEDKKRRKARPGKSCTSNRQSDAVEAVEPCFRSRSRSSDSHINTALHPWTQEEEDWLRLLKPSKTTEWERIEQYFPHRTEKSVALHWSYMTSRTKAELKAKASPCTESSSPSFTPSTALFHNRESSCHQLRLHHSSSQQDNANRIERHSKGMTSGLVDVTSNLFPNQGRVYHNESEEGATVSSSSSLSLCTSKVIQSRFTPNQCQNKDQLQEADRLALSNCKEEPVVQVHMNTPIQDVRVVNQSGDFDNEFVRLRIEIESKNSEQFMQQMDDKLETAAAAMNACHSSSDGSEQDKRNSNGYAVAREPHIVENGPAIIETQCNQNLTAQGTTYGTQVVRHGDKDQSGPIKDEPMLNTVPQQELHARHAPTAAASVTPVRQNCADVLALLPQSSDSPLANRLDHEHVPNAHSAHSNAKPKQEYEHTSIPSDKAYVVRVVIPVTTSDRSRNAKVDLINVKSVLTIDNENQTKSNTGNIPGDMLPRSASPDVSVEEYQVPVSAGCVEHSSDAYDQHNRSDLDLEDPLGFEIPNSQPRSVSFTKVDSLGRPGIKATRNSAIAQQPLQYLEEVVPSRRGCSRRSRKTVKLAVADPSSSLSEATVDFSEDELSFL